jgi:anti-sigma B factor antagonist
MIDIRVAEPVTILDLPASIETAKLQEQVQSVIKSGAKKVALNLTNITFIESSGLGALVAVFKICENAGVGFALYSPQPYLLKLVEITKLDRILRILPDEAEALKVLTA